MSSTVSCIDRFRENWIYPVTSQSHSQGRGDEIVVAAMLAGGARVIQLRDKGFSEQRASSSERAAFVSKIRRLKKQTEEAGALLIVNDHLDIALSEADGVHLGQDDCPSEAAFAKRNAQGRDEDFIVGLSTHNETEALAAATLSLHHPLLYINVGPIYPTQTKPHPDTPPLGVSGWTQIYTSLASICVQTALPITVMGGLKEDHLSDLAQAGARHFAMVTEITTAPDIEKKVRSLIETARHAKPAERGMLLAEQLQ